VDLSHWNGDVDFVALKASGIEFVILKATEGVDWVDDKFDEYWRAAHEAGLLIMTYHFFRSNYGGAPQATHHKDTLIELGFLETVGYQSPVMWADVETTDGASVSQRQNRLYAFHQTIIGYGYQSGHYSSPYLWNSLIGNVSWAADYPGWDAHWTSASIPTLPLGWTRNSTRVWQNGIYPTHSWVEPVDGTPGAVDHNYFYGSLQDMKDWLGVEVAPPPMECCDELYAEIARLETEINSNKLEIYKLQQGEEVTDERLLEIEAWIQSVKSGVCT
jgi:GH25 family lysozyme M1 (1,4-beta-N-acetylmuramidase)